MELAAVLILLASGAIGLALRNHLSPRVGRALLVVGSSALLLGFAVMGLVFAGWIVFWTGAALALVSFIVAILVLPLALAVTLWRLQS